MNPATAEKEKLKHFRQLGINRLSIGMQSSDARELSCLGRVHSYSDFLTTFQDAREARFDNINADVMYGIPHQSIDSFKKTLTSLISLSPEHISAYSLKIEEGTPFYTVRDTLLLPSEEEEYEMYCLCHDMLSSAGYTHYEISNYAKDEKHSRHNLKYWHGEEYLGFGVAAYSYFDAKRYGNTDSISEYIEKNGRCEHIDIDTLTPCDIESEYIMLRLRLREGIDDTDFLLRFGVKFSEKYARQIDKFLHTEYMKCENGRYFLTDEGMYVSNSILIEFI
jgi:oxygen-independent coproporphyrinogen-3 oxidase